MAIKLSDHFSYKRLLKFTLPSILMMIFMSVYGIVDGIFVSNFAGDAEFTALNFIYPVIMIFSAPGFMFGSGGSALISKTLGMGDKKKANQIFSLVVYSTIVCGIIFAIIGLFSIKYIAMLMGAKGTLLNNAVKYATPIVIALPVYMLQLEFQTFFITAEKPKLGFICTLCAGLANIFLDFLCVGVLGFGLVGASVATAVSQLVGGIIPVIYFFRKNSSLLRIGKPYFDFKALVKICTNGSSELLSNVAMSLVGMLYNIQLLKYAGEGGVSAYGVLSYVSMLFNAMFIGFSIGTAPVIGYHYGAKNNKELTSLLKKSIVILLITSIAMFAISEATGGIFANIFVGNDLNTKELTIRGFTIFSFAFLFMGFSIFLSSFFTALNDGFTSAMISFLRTIVFQVAAVIILPLILDIDGIWISLVVAEFASIVVAIIFLFAKKKKYNY